MEFNFHSKCRACLSENDSMLSLFEVYEHGLTLAMILQTCIATEVNENDGLPSHLCDSCILVLTQFYNFTVVYEESDKHLRKLLKQNKKLLSINQSSEFETNVNDVPEQVETVEVEIGETNDDVLNEIVAVEVTHEDIISNCTAPNNIQFYEYKNDSCDLEEQEEGNDVPDYGVQQTETVQEFKKEIILPEEELENIVGDVEYANIEMQKRKDVFIKKEIRTIKKENAQYEEIIKYECTICGESHLYATGFQQHMRIKHHMSDIDCEDYASRIQVKIHNQVDAVNSNLASSHQENIDLLDNETTLKCKYCHKEFFSAQLQHHLKLHEANRKYVCEVCGARFIRKTYLDDHKEGHSTEKKHVCKFCGKAFRRRTVLRAHKRVHTHPNHYVCEQCGRAFTNSSTLKTHKLLIHVRERNFQCVICNLKFPLKSTLNKHVLRHQKRENGEKGFNCPQCEMQYRDKSSLKRHIDTKHKGRIQLVACGDCPKKYTSKANLMKHRRRHHGGVTMLEISS